MMPSSSLSASLNEDNMPTALTAGVLMSSALLLGLPAAPVFAETTVAQPLTIISASKSTTATFVKPPALKTASTTVKPTLKTSTTAAKSAAVVTKTKAATTSAPKSGIESAKEKLSAAVATKTQAQSELRAAKSAADQARAAYTLAQKNAKQAKQSYINANDRLASMRSASGVSKTAIAEQQKKVGTCWNVDDDC
jgi:hypothetical protein